MDFGSSFRPHEHNPEEAYLRKPANVGQSAADK